MNGKHDGICPRCGIRPKEEGHSYCPECRRKYQSEIRRKRMLAEPEICARCRRNLRAPGKTLCQPCLNQITAAYRARSRRRTNTAAKFKALLAEAKACRKAIDKMKNGGSIDAPVDAAKTDDSPKPRRMLPGREFPVDPGMALEQMADACRLRGYDPGKMLGLARVLPLIDFKESTPGEHSSLRPVWRGRTKTVMAQRKSRLTPPV